VGFDASVGGVAAWTEVQKAETHAKTQTDLVVRNCPNSLLEVFAKVLGVPWRCQQTSPL